MKKLACIVLLLCMGLARAGSYEDWFRAVQMDNPGPVRDLLRRGFDANALDPAGHHALFVAAREGSLQVATLLADWPRTRVEWRNKADESPLMMAALKGHTDLVRKLIDKGADVNKTGWTPLHYAATHGHLEIMALLLEHHAYIDAESPNRTTPLMMAAHYGTTAAVKLLLDSGADPTLRNELGMNAIDFANKASRSDAAALIAAAIRAKAPRGTW